MPPKRDILMIGAFIKAKNNSKVSLYLTETHLLMITVRYLLKTVLRARGPVESASSPSPFEWLFSRSVGRIICHSIKWSSKEKRPTRSSWEPKRAINGLTFWSRGSPSPITHFSMTSISQSEKEVSQPSNLNVFFIFTSGLHRKEEKRLVTICRKGVI